MARFYFNVRDGQANPDQTGTDLPSLVAARAYAIQVVCESLQGDSTTVWQAPTWHVEVTDDRGLVLFDIHVIATVSPAVHSGQ